MKGVPWRICGCVTPDERPDGFCGVCKLRRLGDDLTRRQTAELAVALTPVLGEPARDDRTPGLHRRHHGRLRTAYRVRVIG